MGSQAAPVRPATEHLSSQGDEATPNALTRKVAGEVRGDVKVNAVCPGWARTRMGGQSAPRSVADAADTIVWLATLPPGGPSDGSFRDRRPIAW